MDEASTLSYHPSWALWQYSWYGSKKPLILKVYLQSPNLCWKQCVWLAALGQIELGCKKVADPHSPSESQLNWDLKLVQLLPSPTQRLSLYVCCTCRPSKPTNLQLYKVNPHYNVHSSFKNIYTTVYIILWTHFETTLVYVIVVE